MHTNHRDGTKKRRDHQSRCWARNVKFEASKGWRADRRKGLAALAVCDPDDVQFATHITHVSDRWSWD